MLVKPKVAGITVHDGEPVDRLAGDPIRWFHAGRVVAGMGHRRDKGWPVHGGRSDRAHPDEGAPVRRRRLVDRIHGGDFEPGEGVTRTFTKSGVPLAPLDAGPDVPDEELPDLPPVGVSQGWGAAVGDPPPHAWM